MAIPAALPPLPTVIKMSSKSSNRFLKRQKGVPTSNQPKMLSLIEQDLNNNIIMKLANFSSRSSQACQLTSRQNLVGIWGKYFNPCKILQKI